jgi:2-dehydro-3-deoxygluconokinase
MTARAGTAPDAQPPEVITFGEAMVLLLGEPGLPLAQALDFRRQVAGAEVNVAVGLARLGHRAGWFGRVGADAFGAAVLGELRRDGVDVTRARVDDAAATGLLVRDCPRGRSVEVLYYRTGSAGSRLGVGDVDTGYVGDTQVLHATGITPVLSDSAREATLLAVSTAKQAGVTVSFDPNVRSRLCHPEQAAPVLRELAGSADIVLAGVEEARLLTGQEGRDAMAAWFLDRGARLVVLKDGAAGSCATDGHGWVEQPAMAAQLVDPVGAGDAFAAGFLSARLLGLDLAASLERAAVVAALVVQVPGDMPGLPDADAVAAALGGGPDVAR